MSPHSLFPLVNLVAAAAWLALAIFPRQRWARALARLGAPVLFASAYAIIIAIRFPGAPGGFSSLEDVALLFSHPWLLLAGWIHYLAFDLLIGSWEIADAQERGVAHWMVVPCLLLTFLFGPAGWLLYLGVRSAGRKRAI